MDSSDSRDMLVWPVTEVRMFREVYEAKKQRGEVWPDTYRVVPVGTIEWHALTADLEWR